MWPQVRIKWLQLCTKAEQYTRVPPETVWKRVRVPAGAHQVAAAVYQG